VQPGVGSNSCTRCARHSRHLPLSPLPSMQQVGHKRTGGMAKVDDAAWPGNHLQHYDLSKQRSAVRWCMLKVRQASHALKLLATAAAQRTSAKNMATMFALPGGGRMLTTIPGTQLPASRFSPSLAIQAIAGGRACRQQRFDTLCMATNRDMSAQAAAVSPVPSLADRDVCLSRPQQLLSYDA